MSIDINEDVVQYLSFYLNLKLFAFDVLKTKEVLSYSDVAITHIPGSPFYMVGVLNLRGMVVPVLDLRKKFGIAETEPTENTSIIIVESNLLTETAVVGVLVDAVKDVKTFEKSQLEPPPKLGIKVNSSLITAIGKTDDDFVLILNVDKILSDEDVTIAKEAFLNDDVEDDSENK